MRATTLALVLFAFAALALAESLEWMALVFAALGIAVLLFYKEAALANAAQARAKTEKEKTHHGHAGRAPPRQIVVVQEGEDTLSKAIAEKIVEHEMLGRARPHGKKG